LKSEDPPQVAAKEGKEMVLEQRATALGEVEPE
jgi:hypothetical protein